MEMEDGMDKVKRRKGWWQEEKEIERAVYRNQIREAMSMVQR